MDVRKIKLDHKFKPIGLWLWEIFLKEDSNHKNIEGDKKESSDLPSVPTLEGDEEEVKEGTRIKILTPKKLLTRLPVLIPQIKAENNSCKLQNEIRQCIYFINTAK